MKLKHQKHRTAAVGRDHAEHKIGYAGCFYESGAYGPVAFSAAYEPAWFGAALVWGRGQIGSMIIYDEGLPPWVGDGI